MRSSNLGPRVDGSLDSVSELGFKILVSFMAMASGLSVRAALLLLLPELHSLNPNLFGGWDSIFVAFMAMAPGSGLSDEEFKFGA